MTKRVAVVTTAGKVIPYWFFNRYADFEQRRLPVEAAKAKQRALPALVEQLNRIRHEAVATE